MASIAEAQEDLVLAHTPTTRYESPISIALYLSRRLRYRVNWKALVGDREPVQKSLLSFFLPERERTDLIHVQRTDVRLKAARLIRLSIQR